MRRYLPRFGRQISRRALVRNFVVDDHNRELAFVAAVESRQQRGLLDFEGQDSRHLLLRPLVELSLVVEEDSQHRDRYPDGVGKRNGVA